MTDAIARFSTTGWVLLIVALLLLLSVAAAWAGRALVRRGLREPGVVRAINRATERFVAFIKKPITAAVLDEVAEVMRAGHYTRNVAAALRENQVQIREMITEKVTADPAAARSLGLLPFHERLVAEMAEAGLRIVFEVLADPRTDELISDMLRDNLSQIREAVSLRES